MNIEIATRQPSNLPTVMAEDKFIENSAKEKLLFEINGLAEKNLAARRLEELRLLQKRFLKTYLILSFKFFGFDFKKVQGFPKDKRLDLAKLILKRVKGKNSRYLILVFYLIPVFGWVILFALKSRRYIDNFRNLGLRGGLGEHFPHDLLEDIMERDADGNFIIEKQRGEEMKKKYNCNGCLYFFGCYFFGYYF
ncbi:MAG: hypothetical protein HYX20_00705 [Candidatus Yanofskybacteria bacterium]|nr:hypothetical protein [Candidatus Yanofskybacteria bacterium]